MRMVVIGFAVAGRRRKVRRPAGRRRKVRRPAGQGRQVPAPQSREEAKLIPESIGKAIEKLTRGIFPLKDFEGIVLGIILVANIGPIARKCGSLRG